MGSRLRLRPAPLWVTLLSGSEVAGGVLMALGLLGPVGPLAVAGSMLGASATSPTVGAQIRELVGFDAIPYLFGGIEVRSIARQRLDPKPITLAGDPLGHAVAAMREQSVPDQQRRAGLLELADVAQELNQTFVVVGAGISPCSNRSISLYFRFNLSHRDIEELMAERGVRVSYEAIRLWCRKFGPVSAEQLRR